MKKILITGAKGQLGKSIHKLSSHYPEFSFMYTDETELNISQEQEVTAFFNQHAFDAVINCAAYNDVDQAEKNFELAKTINAFGPAFLAQTAKRNKCRFIHVSSDYVFNGKGHRPYQEEDSCQPTSAYGKSKLLGEDMVSQVNEKAMIIRTSWLFSEFGNNFLKTMLKYGQERDELRVVFDQIGTPTYATDLARAILEILSNEVNGEDQSLYHFSNEGVASWYDFATEIMKAAKIDCKVSAIESHEYPLPAKRPYYSVMNKAKIKKDFNLKIPHWRTSMLQCIETLGYGK